MAGLGLATIKRVSKDDDANSERKNQTKRKRMENGGQREMKSDE